LPANLPAEARHKWNEVTLTKNPETKLQLMDEFLSLVPKHKGTDKLCGQVKRQMAQLREEIEKRVTSNTVFIDLNGNQIKPRNLERIVSRMQRRADLEDIKLSPHVLRHTAATMAIDNGLDVFSLQKMFGWEQLQTAMRYVHMSGKRIEEAAKRCSPVDSLNNRGTKSRGRGNWEHIY